MVTETYTEQVPKYKWISYDECRKCGFQSSDYEVMGAHCLECGGTYTTKEKQVQDGFETVTKTRQVPKTVVDDPAHYECSCGKRKQPHDFTQSPTRFRVGDIFRCVALFQESKTDKKAVAESRFDLRCEILKENHGKFFEKSATDILSESLPRGNQEVCFLRFSSSFCNVPIT